MKLFVNFASRPITVNLWPLSATSCEGLQELPPIVDATTLAKRKHCSHTTGETMEDMGEGCTIPRFSRSMPMLHETPASVMPMLFPLVKEFQDLQDFTRFLNAGAVLYLYIQQSSTDPTMVYSGPLLCRS